MEIPLLRLKPLMNSIIPFYQYIRLSLLILSFSTLPPDNPSPIYSPSTYTFTYVYLSAIHTQTYHLSPPFPPHLFSSGTGKYSSASKNFVYSGLLDFVDVKELLLTSKHVTLGKLQVRHPPHFPVLSTLLMDCNYCNIFVITNSPWSLI